MERGGETEIIELKQTGMNDQIVEDLGFYVSNKKRNWTPAEATPLVKYKNE